MPDAARGPAGPRRRGCQRQAAAPAGFSGSAPGSCSAAAFAGRPVSSGSGEAGVFVLAGGPGAGTGGGLEPPEAKFCDTPTLGTIAVSALQNFVSGGGGGPGASGGHVTAGMASPGAAERRNLRCSLGIKSVLSWPPALKFCWVSFLSFPG
ncbi:PE-PGRS family protein PE_PGRS61-like [Vidua chalybeata]|uniref:PE-PGRS family protein PE_PGRS61-like n=1 Tax=Vidua chalybeata TaxID=81927 RepID=UPI0023A8EC9D|nr:PE-PGRS family protein PE_PGRS61-like [Vidua chalybeata]